MTGTESIDANVQAAINAAESVFAAEKGRGADYTEPRDEVAATVAVRHLRTLFERLPGTIRDALASARASGELLSRDRLQGIAEVLQNADDLGASEVRLQLRDRELLFAHNGSPVTLSDVMALATPWLSTKMDDASATGRFGIGLTALRGLSEVLEVHCQPYRLRIGDPTIDVADKLSPSDIIEPGWTALRVPLEPDALNSIDLVAWFERWDDSALLFLRSVSKVALYDPTGRAIRTLHLSLGAEKLVDGLQLEAGSAVYRQEIQTPDGRVWLKYRAEPTVPRGVRRAHKATNNTTPVAVALQLASPSGGYIHAGLPLMPIDLGCRVNAQFDPLTNRNDLADTKWNEALYGLVAELWAHALIDFFERDPGSAWQAIPAYTADELMDGPTPTAKLQARIVQAARQEIAGRLSFTSDAGVVLALADFAVESVQLQGVVEPDEIASLARLPATLPLWARDAAGRWREVMKDWRDVGASLPPEVDVVDALVLLPEESRTPEATISLASAAIEAGLADDLSRLACIVVESGEHVRPPQIGDAVALAEKRTPLGEELGLVRVLHRAYSDESEASTKVLVWLKGRRALVEDGNPTAILERLASVGRMGHPPLVLKDEQIQRLRDAFEQIPLEDREQLGQYVGRAIQLDAFSFGNRKRLLRTLARPADAYLPPAIDREPDSFAVAAGETPEIVWLDARYAQVLRSPLGRQGLGAQRFLRLLGAEISPRLEPHPSLERRYQTDARRGLAASFGAGDVQARVAAVRRAGATYTLEDRSGADLLAVVQNISRERRASRRRRRANSLLSTLGRAWGRLGDLVEVDAVTDSWGWNQQGTVRAFWLWQVAGIPWLDNASGKPCQADELRVRTEATLAIYGRDSAGYLHPTLDVGNHREPLAALGVHGEPTTEELVNRLRELRDAVEPRTEADWHAIRIETAVVYQALSFRIAAGTPSTDFPRSQFRRAFSQGSGLILVNRRWLKPGDVRRGAPFLGERMTFVPPVPNTDHLWQALDIRLPTFEDCIEVLRRISRSGDPVAADDQAVMLETFRFLVTEFEGRNVSERDRRALRSLPLFTTMGWVRERPVYGVDDPQLTDALGALIPTWQPGGDLDQFQSLVNLLRITLLHASSFAVIDPDRASPDEEQTGVARRAVQHLRSDLERNAPDLATGLQVEWDALEQLVVRELPGMRLRTLDSLLGKLPPLEVSAWMETGTNAMFIRDIHALPRADAGGRTIASLFKTRRREVAQAWRVAWDDAEEGRTAERLRTAEERSKVAAAETAAEIRSRTEAFQTRVENRTGSPAPVIKGNVAPSVASMVGGTQGSQGETPRTLVDLSMLRLVNPSGRVLNPGGRASEDSVSGTEGAPPRGSVPLPPPLPGGARPNAWAAPRAYTENDKESLGLDLVRWLLASDASEIVDIRGQRGVGADAVDELERFYELKVSAGDEPNTVSLTEAELIRALTTPDYFLIIVSGLEGATARPRIRVLVDPLRQLRPSTTGSVALTGLREAGGIIYEFASNDGQSAS